MPRSQQAAVKPARSVTAPPPTATIASERVTRCAASRDHRSAATAMSLAASPSGIASACTTYPASASTWSAGRAISPRLAAWTTTAVWTSWPTSDGTSPGSPGRLRALELAGDLGRYRSRGSAVRADGDPGQLGVDRQPLLKKRLQLRPGVTEQQRPRTAQPDSLRRDGESGFEVNDLLVSQQPPGAGIEHRSATEPEHARMAGDGAGYCLAFKRPEHRLAVLDEDVADRLARHRLDVAVGIAEGDAQQAGQQRADGRLASARRPDQDGGRPAHAITSDSR